MDPTGLYENNRESIDYWVREHGSYREEYAVFGERLITREEYDDGAAVVDGRVVPTAGKAKLRCRYITSHNMVVAAHMSPINNNEFDSVFEEIMNGILRGVRSVEDLASAVSDLPRHGGRDG
jgi:hypothetical protein